VSAWEDGTVRLWDLKHSRGWVVSDNRSYNGGAGAASDDGSLVSMSWSDSEVRVFDAASSHLSGA
jgi:WD40 repeat protein